MLTDEVFLQAIRANPQDEAPWLIYADWLEEHGDPRAALYRRPRWTNALGMKFVLVPRGRFWMGKRRIRKRPVDMPHEFYLGAYPVTQEQWQAVMGGNPSWFSRQGSGADRVENISDADLRQFPVENVSWDDDKEHGVQEFLKRLNAKEKKRSFLFRLPTEAEWEYACRGAATTRTDCAFDFYFAQPTNDLSSEQANFNGNYPAGGAPKGNCLERTTKVNSYQPNRLGLYDMHGNVWEWCADHFKADGSACVFRGGGWNDRATSCRASSRNGTGPGGRGSNVGLRVAAVPSGE